MQPTPFSVRGPTYLKDQKKMPAGLSQFVLAAMDVVEVPEPVMHVARFLPSVSCNSGSLKIAGGKPLLS